ncbi:unnamed protein product [Hydatigera taeniaeformis]|uniref:HNH endonuclease n=1 Tax=Hydatigena taeniaeformis TaxID=6205 RepID=A0A0R3WPS2_HYDTA|nr:unnamed protein product [Hydatigera taeniaeformis]
MNLIEEINKLRVELRNSRHRVRDLETTMGINRKQGTQAREILAQITGHRPNPVIVAELAQANRTLHEQSHFMHLLQERLRLGAQYCTDNGSNVAGGSLPPLTPVRIVDGKGREGKWRPATEPQSPEEPFIVPEKATPRANSVT